MLATRHINLLSPATWEDRNDSYYLERYQVQRELKTVLAVCFSTKRERFHHWKVFASGPSGICIEFDRELLLDDLSSDSRFHSGMVKYRTIKDLRYFTPRVETWPFLKRYAYKDEGEFRIIYENPRIVETTKSFEFRLPSINKITLSPWMPKSVAHSVEKVIRGIKNCADISVNHSTLVESDLWKAIVHTPSAS